MIEQPSQLVFMADSPMDDNSTDSPIKDARIENLDLSGASTERPKKTPGSPVVLIDPTVPKSSASGVGRKRKSAHLSQATSLETAQEGASKKTKPNIELETPPDSEPQIPESNDDSKVLIIPTEPIARKKFLDAKVFSVMIGFGKLCMIRKPEDEHGTKLDAEKTQELVLFLRALSNLNGITSKLAKEYKLKPMLQVVLNRTAESSSSFRYNFPPQAVLVAQRAYDHYEQGEWGVTADREIAGEEEGEEEDVDELPSSPITAQPTVPQNALATHYAMRAPSNHPIFGLNGIMKGIIPVRRPGRVRTWVFDDTFQRRPCNVPGHNGIVVGTWWPLQRCALRDGAHGHTMGGIAGTAEGGALSIVVSGAYSTLDKDHGDVLYYSGSGSHKNIDSNNAPLTNATRALRTSFMRRQDVRVIRSKGGHWNRTPREGFRYDGLYRITRETQLKNDVGGAYYQFRLDRIPNQPPYDFSRPNAQDMRDFERIREFY